MFYKINVVFMHNFIYFTSFLFLSALKLFYIKTNSIFIIILLKTAQDFLLINQFFFID